MVDYEKLKGVFDTSGYRYDFIAKNVGMSFNLFSKKISGLSHFKVPDVYKLKKFLRLTDEQVMDIFFSDEDEVKTK